MEGQCSLSAFCKSATPGGRASPFFYAMLWCCSSAGPASLSGTDARSFFATHEQVMYYNVPDCILFIFLRCLEVSTAPTVAKSREPAYSQALSKTKSIGSWSDPESQAGYGGWCLELRWGGR